MKLPELLAFYNKIGIIPQEIIQNIKEIKEVKITEMEVNKYNDFVLREHFKKVRMLEKLQQTKEKYDHMQLRKKMEWIVKDNDGRLRKYEMIGDYTITSSPYYNDVPTLKLSEKSNINTETTFVTQEKTVNKYSNNLKENTLKAWLRGYGFNTQNEKLKKVLIENDLSLLDLNKLELSNDISKAMIKGSEKVEQNIMDLNDIIKNNPEKYSDSQKKILNENLTELSNELVNTYKKIKSKKVN